MSRSEPTIRVTCDGDGCERRAQFRTHQRASIRVELTAIGDGDWSEGTVDASLRSEGWTVDGDRDLCPECSKEKDNAK